MAFNIKSNSLAVNHSLMFIITRFILGLLLAIKGIYFFVNVTPLYYIIKDSRLDALDISMPLGIAISVVHMLGGVFIIAGLFTKASAWAQVPILVGAIIFINAHNSLSFTYPGLLISLVVLALLLLFAIKGGGGVSVDNYAKRHLL